MALSGTLKYNFWDWCIKQSNLPDTPEQKRCVHDFGKTPLVETTLDLEIWQCSRCKKINVANFDNSEDY